MVERQVWELAAFSPTETLTTAQPRREHRGLYSSRSPGPTPAPAPTFLQPKAEQLRCSPHAEQPQRTAGAGGGAHLTVPSMALPHNGRAVQTLRTGAPQPRAASPLAGPEPRLERAPQRPLPRLGPRPAAGSPKPTRQSRRLFCWERPLRSSAPTIIQLCLVWCKTVPLGTAPVCVLSASRDGDTTMPLRSPFHSLLTPSVKKCLVIPHPKPPRYNLRPFTLILSPSTKEKNHHPPHCHLLSGSCGARSLWSLLFLQAEEPAQAAAPHKICAPDLSPALFPFSGPTSAPRCPSCSEGPKPEPRTYGTAPPVLSPGAK